MESSSFLHHNALVVEIVKFQMNFFRALFHIQIKTVAQFIKFAQFPALRPDRVGVIARNSSFVFFMNARNSSNLSFSGDGAFTGRFLTFYGAANPVSGFP